MNSLVFFARRALNPVHSAIVNMRCYCSPPSSSLAPNSKLFVAGLSWSVDEKSLKDAFSSFGEVTEDGSYNLHKSLCLRIGHRNAILCTKRCSLCMEDVCKRQENVKIIYDKDSGRSRGFGFVHFSKEDEAKCAKDAMDGKALLGRPLRISFALERVRGEPVVVPRITNVGDISCRNT